MFYLVHDRTSLLALNFSLCLNKGCMCDFYFTKQKVKLCCKTSMANCRFFSTAKISVTSPIVINMPTRELLAGQTKSSFV